MSVFARVWACMVIKLVSSSLGPRVLGALVTYNEVLP